MAVTENEMRVDQLLTRMTEACAKSAVQLQQQMTTTANALPHHYTIPKMSIELKLSMSYSQGVVKGFFTKRSSETEASSLSTISLDIVAVPKQPAVDAT